jgi:hypothetical protein
MLDCLSPELLREIFLISLPPESYSTYFRRQALLRSYSLVCRDTGDVAQSLLSRVVRINVKLKPDLEERPDLALQVRTLESRGDMLDDLIVRRRVWKRLSTS